MWAVWERTMEILQILVKLKKRENVTICQQIRIFQEFSAHQQSQSHRVEHGTWNVSASTVRSRVWQITPFPMVKLPSRSSASTVDGSQRIPSTAAYHHVEVRNNSSKQFSRISSSTHETFTNIFWHFLPSPANCNPPCLNRGICDAPGRCSCPDNFMGPSCQFKKQVRWWWEKKQ